MTCETEDDRFPIKIGVETVIGQIIGVTINEISAGALTITSFMLIFVSFLICLPYFLDFHTRIKEILQELIANVLGQVPRIGWILSFVGKRVVGFFVGIRSSRSSYLALLGMLVGYFLNISGLSDALENELINFNKDWFKVLFIPPLFMSATYLGTKRKIIFPNYVLVFFHHFVLVFLHLVGIVITCFALSAILYFALLLKYSYLECLLISGIMAGVSSGPLLGVLNRMKANFRLFDILEGEKLFSAPLSMLIYGVSLYLIIGVQAAAPTPSIATVVGLAFLRLLYMVFIGLSVGLSLGFIGCLFVKFTNEPKQLRVFQPLCVCLFLFLSYFLSNIFQSSGLLGMVPCAFFMSRYSHFAMGSDSRKATEVIITLFAKVAGQLIYFYLGIIFMESVYVMEFDFLLIILVTFFTIFLRVIFIFTVNFAWNAIFRVFFRSLETQHSQIIPVREIFVMACSGLKGPLPFIYAFVLPTEEEQGIDNPWKNRDLFVTTTLIVTLFSVFVQAPLIHSIIKTFKIQKRRMSIKEKVDICREMLEKLENIQIFTPRKESTEEKHKILMCQEVNRNWRKFRVLTQEYHLRTREFKERREGQYLFRNSGVKFHHILYKCYDMLELVYNWTSKTKSQICANPNILIFIDPDFGVDLDDLERLQELSKEIDVQKDRVQKRFTGLLRLKQYEDSLVKVSEEKYISEMEEAGHVPVSSTFPNRALTYSPQVEKHDNSFFDRCSKWKDNIIDVGIQRIINVGGVTTKERIFLKTTYLLRKYQRFDGGEGEGENNLDSGGKQDAD